MGCSRSTHCRISSKLAMSLLHQDLQQSLLKGYISDKNESKLELLPEFLFNDTAQNHKVLTINY